MEFEIVDLCFIQSSQGLHLLLHPLREVDLAPLVELRQGDGRQPEPADMSALLDVFKWKKFQNISEKLQRED